MRSYADREEAIEGVVDGLSHLIYRELKGYDSTNLEQSYATAQKLRELRDQFENLMTQGVEK